MNLLLTGAWSDADAQTKIIKEMGHEVRFMQFEKDGLPCDYKWVEGIVCNGLFLSHKIELFENLRYIQLTSAGYDRVPMSYIKEKNIVVKNARGVYSVPMAEYALLGVLQIYKNSRMFYNNQSRHKWEKDRGLLELSGKNVTIIGCGSVGIETAKRFKAFDTYIIGVDIAVCIDKNIDTYRDIDELEEVLKISDIVILTLPLTEKTYHMFNKRLFDIMKRDSVIVNISRGSIVNQQDMINALNEKKIKAAVLDVFGDEPLDENCVLWDMDNVIITPHNSFIGDNNRKRLTALIMNNLKEWNEDNE